MGYLRIFVFVFCLALQFLSPHRTLAGTDAETSGDNESVRTDGSATRADIRKERNFREAEQEFFRWDTNGNLVIDKEEWDALFQEQRMAIPTAEWEQDPAKMKMLDSDKDGALSENELNAWIRERFEKKFKRYISSELFKSRKAEYEQQQAKGAN